MESSNIIRPIHEQRLEKAFKLGPFLDEIESVINQPTDSESSEDLEDESYSDYMANGFRCTKEEKVNDKMADYNFASVRKKRLWLQDVLLSSSDSDEDRALTKEDLDDMLREHKLKKKYQAQYQQKDKPQSYMYYSTGLLSRVDHYPDHQKQLAGHKRKRNKEKREIEKFIKLTKEEPVENGLDEMHHKSSIDDDVGSVGFGEDSTNDSFVIPKRKMRQTKKEKRNKKMDAEALAVRRYKLWVHMSKKEMAKCQKTKANSRKETLQNAKKMATGCSKVAKQKALQSQKNVRDKGWALKRLTRTMLGEWKKFDRIMKENNKRAEKEAEEQRKMDKEILEAKRQQRKVNFLLTLPELYAHFMKNKDDSDPEDGTSSILKKLEDEKPLPSSISDDYDSDAMKAKALKTAQDAYENQQSRLMAFTSTTTDGTNPGQKEHPQPLNFEGQLKSYQLKGMNWLANLYYFGINGILADEMGLGKTVQSVAFLAHICEEYDTWGPFLIVTPASTLHNWTCEIKRFVPAFKVDPYWGNPEERKNLRKFFDIKSIGTRDASFHVAVTSYQIVVQDYKFLNRIKWNYMVLDEAQAIKSSNSNRWKQLLGFSCRNRLLLSGTPIQNSMAELWALLHFIMPTLFDSHSWFNEWFSKDIEFHAENRTAVDERHLNRLHLILKPFMLRRVKTEVENELSDKIEIMMYCPLTLRQKFLYNGLKNKISIDELLRSSVTSQSQQSVTTTLMNLVMQFRKVCNHPELLERREVRSPLLVNPEPYVMPKLVYRADNVQLSLFARNHLIKNTLSIFNPAHIHASLSTHNACDSNIFSFTRFCSLDAQDLADIAFVGLRARFLLLLRHQRERKNLPFSPIEMRAPSSRRGLLITSPIAAKDLIFSSPCSSVYTFTEHTFHHVPETPAHKLMRSLQAKSETIKADPDVAEKTMSPRSSRSVSKSPRKATKNSPDKSIKIEADEHKTRDPIIRSHQATSLPPFIFQTCPKVHSLPRTFYSSDRSAAWDKDNMKLSSDPRAQACLLFGSHMPDTDWKSEPGFTGMNSGGLAGVRPMVGWSRILIPDKHTLIMDAGKLYVLDSLLSRLKAGQHRVLIYSQMTKMIDLLEEFMWHRKHKYMRLDGSSKISDRRDMVDDFQTKSDIFVFLLSTRAGGVGINLTAADTVIFYDSDWNPTVDQQAMDRAHRLGQTKQVTVYRLICKATIEQRILQRATEKSEIQRMVISGGHFKPDALKPKEVVSLLLDDDIEEQYKSKQLERRAMEDQKQNLNREKMRERMRKRYAEKKQVRDLETKRRKIEESPVEICGETGSPNISMASSPLPSESSHSDGPSSSYPIDDSSEGLIIAEGDTTPTSTTTSSASNGGSTPVRGHKRRGRPRGTSARTTRSLRGALSAIEKDSNQGGCISRDASSGSRRGRGRPRLTSSGPGHMGTRQSTSLPMALQLALNQPPQDSHKSSYKS